MRKAFGSLLALIVSAFIISTIVSFFMRDGFENLSVKASSTPVKLTRRMQETTFTVSTEYVSRYDYNWLAEKSQVLKDRAGRRILPVPVNFYLGNNLTHAEYPFAGLDIVDADCNLRSEKTTATRQYFKSLQVTGGENKKVALHLASFRAIPEAVTLHYTDNGPRVAKCLAAQIIALGEISYQQAEDTVSLVLPAFQALRVNLSAGERTQLIDQAGRNIAAALAEAYKKNPAHKVRVILTNAIPFAAAQSLPFSELAGQFVGLTPDELTAIKSAAVNANGKTVPEIEKRIEFGLDTAVVWQLWQTPKVPYFKDASGEPVLYEDLVLSLRRTLTDTDAAGVIQNRKLKAIYASYARDNDEKKKWGESINLPYQRSSGERLMKLQVQMLLDIYDFSAIGLESETYIALEMPSRQKFPLLHATVRPLARKLGFEEKKDGSDISEIEDSLLLMRTAMAQAGK